MTSLHQAAIWTTNKWEDTKILLVLESEEEFDKERMVDFCKDLLLSTDVLNLLLFDDVSLVKNFHCRKVHI